jgi:hypothetical protein
LSELTTRDLYTRKFRALAQSFGDSPKPVLLIDADERSPYKSGNVSVGFNQINILTEGSQLVDLQTRSQVVASLKTFKFLRVYLPAEASAQRKKVMDIIEKELGTC